MLQVHPQMLEQGSSRFKSSILILTFLIWGLLVAAIWHLMLTTGYCCQSGVPHLAPE